MAKQNEIDNQKTWGIIELFGHTELAGEFSKCEIGDFVQINIPDVGVIPSWTKMVNPKAIYAITPCTEEVAKSKAKELKSMPINRWDTEVLIRNKFNDLEAEGKIKRILEQANNEEEIDGNDLPW